MSADDFANGYDLVFGGNRTNGTSGYLGDTWELTYSAGGNGVWYGEWWADWLEVATTVSPSPRMAGAMAYDATDGTVVLFGGYNGTYLNDTWIFNSGTWSRDATSVAPPARAFASMTWDNQINAIVLFGGKNGSQSFNDTWTFADGTWTDLDLTHSPSARYGAAFAGDPVDSSNVLFGGSTGSAETWDFASGAWTELFPSTSPPGRLYASAVYNGGSPSVYLIGGWDGANLSDVWNWGSGDWSCADCSSNGFAGSFGGIASDLPLGSWPLFATGSGTSNQTWLYHSSEWSEFFPSGRPPPYGGALAAYDPDTAQTFVEGGGLPGGYWTDTWGLAGLNWTDLNLNNPNIGHAYGSMAWDGADQTMLYFGGYNGYILNSTYQWSNTNGWVSVSTNSAPPDRYGATFVYDPLDGYVVLFGGASKWYGSGLLNDTWTYKDGTWTNITATAGPAPPARFDAQAVWDGRDAELLLFGGSGPQSLNDTWTFAGGRWTEIHPSTSPPGRYTGGLVYDGATGESYLIGGYDGVPLADLWEFAGGEWTQVTPNAPYGPLGAVLATYDSAAGHVVVYGGNEPVTYSQDTWFWTPVAQPLEATVSANATAIDGPEPIAFKATVSGGVPGYACDWQFGDGTQASTLTVTHTFAKPGTYVVTFFANDSVGNHLVRQISITESGRLALAPVATPSKVVVGVVVVFSSGVSGGSGTINISWSFGDGSGAAFGPTVRHAYDSPQNYTVLVTAEDSVGEVATGTLTVQVITGPLFASAIALPAVGVAPLEVAFTGTVNGGLPPYAVLWNLGDGSTSNHTDLTHNYTTPGSYVVKFYAGDSEGNYRVRELNITVLTPSPLTIAPVESVTSGGAPLSVNFTTTATGGSGSGYVYLWNFGDGTTGTGASVEHSYSQPGLYTPTVDVNDNAGDEATQALAPITVTATSGAPQVVVHATATPEPGSSPTSVGFTASVEGGTPPYTFNWSFGDGTNSDEQAPTHAYPTSGQYTVSVTVADSSVPAEHGQDALQVNVGSPGAHDLELAVAADPQSGYSPLTVSFATVATGGSGVYTDYQWTFGDGQSQKGPYATHTYDHAGLFSVSVFVTDSIGDNASVNLTVKVQTATIMVAIKATPASIGAAPYTVGLVGSATGGTDVGFTYAWNFGDRSNGSGQAVAHTYDTPGNYTITLTVTDSEGNVGSATINLEVTPAAKAAATTSTFLGLQDAAWYLILPLVAVVAIMAAVLFLQLRRPMVLATRGEEEETAPPVGALPDWPPEPLVVLETADEDGALTMASKLPKENVLVIARLPPESLAQEKGFESANVWQLAVSEGENRLRPGDLEQIGHLMEKHLSAGKDRAVVLAGVDMLLDATSLKAVRRLLAVSREMAAEHGGRVLVALNPKGLAKEDKVHLEEGATVLRH